MIERRLEQTIFASRWLMAPFYLGLIGALIILLVKFAQELFYFLPKVLVAKDTEVILAVLTLIDLSLAGNLVLIVIFSGYENFVSKINTGNHEDRPNWMGSVDFSGLKMKLIGSIVAISAISLLRSFLKIGETVDPDFNWQPIFWQVIIHLTFVVSGVAMAMSDWLQSRTGDSKAPEDPG